MVKHHLAAVIFDLDGTLLDSERVICDAVSRACARFGRSVTAQDVAPHLGAPLTELFATFFDVVVDGVNAHEHSHKEYAAFHRAYVEEHDSHAEEAPRLLPGVAPTLAGLSERGIPMAVATTKPSARAAVQLERLNIAHLFGHIQGTDAPMAFKPAPDVVLAACSALSIASHLTIMVGDTARDVGAGIAAKAATAVVAYNAHNHVRASKFGADLVMHSIEELLVLPGLASR